MEEQLVAAAAGFLAARGTKFIDELLSPLAAEVGREFAKGYRSWRTKNLGEVAEKASAMLVGAAIYPQPVPGRILMPILEHASFEDDPDIQKLWAALLANAASPGAPTTVMPAFADVLRQLTPVHAALLSWMFSFKQQPSDADLPATWPDVPRGTIQDNFKLTPDAYALLLSDLERLQILEGRRPQNRENVSFEEVMHLAVDRWNSRVKYDWVSFTTFGIGFMSACSPPGVP
jgi:hypothetical protein